MPSTDTPAAASGTTPVAADAWLEAADLIGRVNRRLHRGTNEALAPYGLSRAQARVVRLIADGPLKMAAIAERLDVVPRTVTDLVDGVEAAGIVVRRPDPHDRRSTLVELSSAGRDLVDRLDAVRRASAAQVLGCLCEDDRESLVLVLRRLAANGGRPRDGERSRDDDTTHDRAGLRWR
jgi:DNA-binding MarR family transcriptional regulator